jgi:sugar O-acyltransferase (sialic acid O-acetyltransferase NeuD family)
MTAPARSSRKAPVSQRAFFFLHRFHMTPLVIVGAGGLGRETAFLVEQINSTADAEARWDLRGFADDNPALHDRRVLGHSVLGGTAWLTEQRSLRYTIAVGDSAQRKRLARDLEKTPLQAASLLHPSVAVHRTTHVKTGAIICAGVALTVDVHIGRYALVDVNSSVSHDAVVEDFATVHPGAHLTGNARLEAGAELGAGAVVLPGVSVGAHAVVGAGAVVHRDLPASCTATGVPARPLDAS